MRTMDDVLVDVGEVLDRLAAARQPAEPARSVASHRSPEARRDQEAQRLRRRGVWLAAAAIAAVAGAGVAVAVRSDGSPGSVLTTDPGPTPGTPDPTAAEPATSMGPTDPEAVDPAASTPPDPSISSAVGSSIPIPAMESVIPLDQIGANGAAVVPAVLPDGYRPVIAHHTEGPATGLVVTEPGTWVATFIDRRAPTDQRVPTISVQLNDATDRDPYELYPWAPGSPDVEIGPYTGRVANGAPDSATILIPLPDGRLLSAYGVDTPFAAIEQLAAGLVVRSDGSGVDATVVPDGFELIMEGPTSAPTGAADWRLYYAKDEREETMFIVTTTLQPKTPAIFYLTMPEGGEVQVAGHTGYRTPDGFVFDLRPDLQVAVTSGAMYGPGLTPELLAQIVESLVALPPTAFDRYAAAVAEHPLAPIDLPCNMYVRLVHSGSDDPILSGEWEVAAPGPVEVEIRATQPMVDVHLVVIGEQVLPSYEWQQAPLTVLPTLDGDTTSVTLTWDGTFGGVPAPAGSYDVGIEAQPDTAAGATCRSKTVGLDPDVIPGPASSTGLQFVVG